MPGPRVARKRPTGVSARERRQQLDVALADLEQRRLDALLGDHLAVHELHPRAARAIGASAASSPSTATPTWSMRVEHSPQSTRARRPASRAAASVARGRLAPGGRPRAPPAQRRRVPRGGHRGEPRCAAARTRPRSARSPRARAPRCASSSRGQRVERRAVRGEQALRGAARLVQQLLALLVAQAQRLLGDALVASARRGRDVDRCPSRSR